MVWLLDEWSCNKMELSIYMYYILVYNELLYMFFVGEFIVSNLI